ncbi:MAG: DNA adenine methylase [Gammaproteobacteria bacterium]|nr:MAG: DNA adenine methylase [Gammaproteobacteria bacterium]
MEQKITRPALRYVGSKFRISDWIIKHFPSHDCYVEPYGGAAAVLLRKNRSLLEVYNDMDEEVVNFFRVLREKPVELIEALRWTPYALREWECAQKVEPELDVVERARRFYIRSWMGIAGPTAQCNTGWRRQKMISKVNGRPKMVAAARLFMNVDSLYQVAERWRGVQIECGEAIEVIERYDTPNTLFYVDPPYLAETRGKRSKAAYRYEMDEDQHRELAMVLREIKGMALISGYPSALYDELYGDWVYRDKWVRVNGAGSALERLWLSPAAVEKQVQRLLI